MESTAVILCALPYELADNGHSLLYLSKMNIPDNGNETEKGECFSRQFEQVTHKMFSEPLPFQPNGQVQAQFLCWLDNADNLPHDRWLAINTDALRPRLEDDVAQLYTGQAFLNYIENLDADFLEGYEVDVDIGINSNNAWYLNTFFLNRSPTAEKRQELAFLLAEQLQEYLATIAEKHGYPVIEKDDLLERLTQATREPCNAYQFFMTADTGHIH